MKTITLADAEMEVANCERVLAKIDADTATAGATGQALAGVRLKAERALVDGADADFDQLERDERKLAATLRGLAVKRVEVREAHAVANEQLRRARIAHGTKRAQELRTEIARIRAQMAPLETELRALLSGYEVSKEQAPKERTAETDALLAARRTLQEANHG